MVIEARERYRAPTTLIEASIPPVAKPEMPLLEKHKLSAMQIEMFLPQGWQETFARSGTTRLVQKGDSFPDSQIEIHHVSHYRMPAETFIRYSKSNPFETVSKPIWRVVDGKTAWLVDIHKNPDVLSDASQEPDATRTECALNDNNDGSIWLIVFSARSAAIHRREKSMFAEKILPSFHFTSK